MSVENTPRLENVPMSPRAVESTTRSWLLRRLCSQNPFYLLSVCFVLHGTARWFHAESGVAFSPWPLLGLTAGYTLLLAITGFVIIRFGQVWDDARSILLVILLLFVQLSLIFDETLIQDPVGGRWLLLTCWAFSATLSELLLLGLRIRLSPLFRLPYHGLLALLFCYPFSLVGVGARLPTEIVLWRIFLFPAAASVILLTLIPAIRLGRQYTRSNGTPWLWPWYPWSLFVFLGVCVSFRAYALSQSFDPVLGESSTSAMNFSTAFGVYFLIPMFFAVALILLEIGLVEKQKRAVQLALFIPFLCFMLSFPSTNPGGPYESFLRTLLSVTGSPVWLTVLGAVVYYAIATLRRVVDAEHCLLLTLLVAMRIGPRTVDLETLSSPQWWPFLLLGASEFCLALPRGDSRRLMVAFCSAIAVIHFGPGLDQSIPPVVRPLIAPTLFVLSVLTLGACCRDEFAWQLRLVGAPLLVAATIAGCGYIERTTTNLPAWGGPVFVASMTLIALAYAIIVGMPLYRLASLLCGVMGSLGLIEMAVAYFIKESGWRGATSFVAGLACLFLATVISSWKAGWLKHLPSWLEQMLTIRTPRSA